MRVLLRMSLVFLINQHCNIVQSKLTGQKQQRIKFQLDASFSLQTFAFALIISLAHSLHFHPQLAEPSSNAMPLLCFYPLCECLSGADLNAQC